MLFDSPDIYPTLDPSNFQGEIAALPDHLESAWQQGPSHALPDSTGIDRVIVAGMGGSAIGADLIRAWMAPMAPVPVITHRDYGLPAWAQGPGTLVVLSSHSGNTEEALSAYDAAAAQGCRRVAVCTGGELASRALGDGVPLWRFEHAGQPRAGVGYSAGLLLSLFTRMGFVKDPSAGVASAVAAMREQAPALAPETPAAQNPAKRYAGQFMGRSVVFFGAEFLAPVARRWKTQVNELAKAWAASEELPEADHNALAGLELPEEQAGRTFSLFLVSPLLGERNAKRMALTRQAYMLQGVSTDFYLAQGEGRLAHQWTALQFGDYVAYYLAIAYEVDPTPVEALVSFKEAMIKK